MAGKNPAFSFTLDEDEQKFQDSAARGFEPIERGWYHVVITDVKLEPYVAPSNYVGKQRLNLTIKVLSDRYAGRSIQYIQVPLFPRYKPTSKRPEGTATAFVGFMEAAGLLVDGKLQVKDWSVLYNKELMAFIDVRPADDKGRVFNEVKGFAGQWRPVEDEDDSADEGDYDISFSSDDSEPPF